MRLREGVSICKRDPPGPPFMYVYEYVYDKSLPSDKQVIQANGSGRSNQSRQFPVPSSITRKTLR